MIRTAGNPFRSRPSRWLLRTVLAVCGAAVLLPFAPFAAALGFEPFPAAFLLFLVVVSGAYLGCVELAKRRFLRGPDEG